MAATVNECKEDLHVRASARRPKLPFQIVDTGKPERVEPGVALCLSGGGYRAMLFHVGAIWRLNELALLLALDRVSSVSGGSINRRRPRDELEQAQLRRRRRRNQIDTSDAKP